MMKSVKGLIEYFVKYPILANVIIALTLLAGVVSLLHTKKSFFPTQKDKNIIIQVAYPGASPEEMEEGVTLKVEEALTSIAGIDEIISTSSENSANITVVTLESYAIDEVYTDIKNAVDGISSFPVNAEKPIIYKQRQQSVAQWLGLTGDVDLRVLERYAKDIKDDLLASGVISQVNINGLPPREISIEVSEQDLARYGITFDEVANAVRQNNQDISAGSIKAETEEILIRSNAKETDAAIIGEITVRSNADGSKLLLKDIATIKEQYAEQPQKALLNGKRAVFIQVNKLEDEDLQEISAFVTPYVEEFNSTHNGVKLELTWDFMTMLNQRLELLTSNGLIGLFLVLIALGTFLSLRLSFWVAWGIPSSFLGMFVLGSFVGLTINMISLFGMILVIGILVDDGIVIAENIYSHFEKTKNPIKAAIQGTLEVVPAVFTSVTTTIVAFLPLLFLTGGFEFLRDMAFVVIFSLAFSLLEAFFVLPAHLASKTVLSVKKEDTRSHKIRGYINRGIDFMRYSLYGNMLKYTIKYRAVSICFLIGLFPIIMGLFQGGFIKSTFFPQIPFTSFNINIAFKPGERESKVEAYLERFDNAVWEVNSDLKEELDIEEDIVNYTFGSVGNTGDGSESGSHAGNINVFHKELDDYGINSFDLIRKIEEKIGPVPEAEKFNIGGGNRWGKPISVRLLGKNYEELQQAKDFLKAELVKITDLKDVEDNVAIGRREMLFDLTPEAYFLGLTHNDITKQIRQGFFGEEVQRLQKGDDEVRVWVRYPGSGRLNVGQLEDMKVKTQQGEQFPLTQVSNYTVERGISGIRHYNTNRAVTVEADMVDPFGEVPPILNKVQTEIVPQLQTQYPTVKVDYGGQAKESARAGQEIGLFFGGAFLLIFFIIMITFRSFYQAVMILAMIPLGWIGAAIGHGLEGHPVSLLSAWGMIALSGVIINDAVVFLAKYNSLVKDDGQSVSEAAYNAGIARFRAIMLTSITTVAGLWPLIMEKSFQAQFLIPMAISVAYGVLVGTFIILLFFPVLILFFNDVRRFAKWVWTGEKPLKEDVERALIDEERVHKYDIAA
ncbi:Acriflavin resistance protein [Fulvivirga imtechensis AK7]|uniref:Acriflavin resistance protein n=1 Tax=Fulvivirga imtechensis AK7 TaxID=1237149 RepID=L8K1P9_9BACT|nr:efflux RND transporter permease subunit [Fulvivirga imtechensis]ELR73854.1 Acriflavin resistance protein [Fulvivirga imtechensis AK7]